MSKILYVNPVGSRDFDQEALDLINKVRLPQFEPVVASLEIGPPHLEYHNYEHDAYTPMLKLFQEAEAEGFSAGIIGCFYDGGLRELREACKMPIVGMGEASYMLAATMGNQFSVIVGRRKWIAKMRDMVILYGLDRRLASFRSVEMGIPEMFAKPDKFWDRVIEESKKAVYEDYAEVVVLSEYATPEFWERARRELPDAPIIDSGVASWKYAEMAASLYETIGYTHAKVGGYEAPPQREWASYGNGKQH